MSLLDWPARVHDFLSKTLWEIEPERRSRLSALRLLQFVNANYAGTEAVSASVSALALELVILLAVSSVAVVRRRYLWLFALAWTVVAATPYALVSHGPDLGLVPVLVKSPGFTLAALATMALDHRVADRAPARARAGAHVGGAG